MFSSLFILILTLLLVSLGNDLPFEPWIADPISGLVFSLFLYIGLLCLLRLTNMSINGANFAILAFILFQKFVLGGDRLFLYPLVQTGPVLITLLYYLGALWFYDHFHWGSVRLLIPFILPFILFTLILDGLYLIPYPPLKKFLFKSSEDPIAFIGFLFLTLGITGGILCVLPKLVQAIWNCQPIEPKYLLERLDKVCKQLNFKHSGLLNWTLMKEYPTAGIIGILPRYRYILFSPALLRRLTPEALDAVLVHEIGHSYYRHLLWLPVILLGMVILSALMGIFLPPLSPLITLLIYAGIIILYFRFVFGFFSRLFERQADLHIFKTPYPPHWMVNALDEVGDITGESHDHPNWHHYSINQRMNFLKKAEDQPQLVQQHDSKVRTALAFYLSLLTLGFLGLVIYL